MFLLGLILMKAGLLLLLGWIEGISIDFIEHALRDGLKEVDLHFDEVLLQQILTRCAFLVQLFNVDMQLLQLTLRYLVLNCLLFLHLVGLVGKP
jgi:hypothetical protein